MYDDISKSNIERLGVPTMLAASDNKYKPVRTKLKVKMPFGGVKNSESLASLATLQTATNKV